MYSCMPIRDAHTTYPGHKESRLTLWPVMARTMRHSKPPALERIELQVEGRGYVRSLTAGAIAAPNITCASPSSGAAAPGQQASSGPAGQQQQQQQQYGSRDLCADAQAKEEEMGALRRELEELRLELRELKAMITGQSGRG
jgi:hypothetical protein